LRVSSVGPWRGQSGQRVSHDAFDVRHSTITALARIGERTTNLAFSECPETARCDSQGRHIAGDRGIALLGASLPTHGRINDQEKFA